MSKPMDSMKMIKALGPVAQIYLGVDSVTIRKSLSGRNGLGLAAKGDTLFLALCDARDKGMLNIED